MCAVTAMCCNTRSLLMCCVSAAAVDGEVEQLDVDVVLMDTSDQPDTQVTPDLISPFAPADDNLEDGKNTENSDND